MFCAKGGNRRKKKFYYSLKFPEVGPSWGGFETIMNGPGMGISEERAARTGIMQGQIRISVGLESLDSLIEDFDQAFSKI